MNKILNLNFNYPNNINFTAKVKYVAIRKNDLMELVEKGLNYNQIAEIYNAEDAFIKRTIENYKLTPEDLKRLKELESEVFELIKQGKTLVEIPSELGVSHHTVSTVFSRIKQRLNMDAKEIRKTFSVEKKKEVTPKKITKKPGDPDWVSNKIILRERIDKAYQLKKEGYKVEEIAKKFNLSITTIQGYFKMAKFYNKNAKK